MYISYLEIKSPERKRTLIREIWKSLDEISFK